MKAREKFTLFPVQKYKRIKEERKMEQTRKQETKTQETPLEILSQENMSFIRGGDGDPPPVENSDGENG